jgi:hypothetical protein
LYWYAPESKNDLQLYAGDISILQLEKMTIVADFHLNFTLARSEVMVSLRNTTIFGMTDVSASATEPLQIYTRNSTFDSGMRLTGAISSAHVVQTRFSTGPLLFNNTKSGSFAAVNITNCEFINGSVLQVTWANATVRATRFLVSDQEFQVSSRPEQSRTQANLTNSYIDARGNYWGHSSGPYSCCNPKSEGVFAILAETSSWCEDEACTVIHGSSDGTIGSDEVGRPIPTCQLDSFCPVQKVAILGALAGMLAFACVLVAIFGIFSFYKYKTAVAEPTHPGSYSQSGFIMMSRQDPDALRNKTLLFMDIMSIFVACLILVAALLPTVIIPQKRQTSVTQKTQTWFYVATACIVGSRALRIISSLWHFLVIKLGRPAYVSLLGNAIFSSAVIQFSIIFRLLAFVNDLAATSDMLHYDPLPPLQLPTGLLISYTTFFWALWALTVLSDVLLAIPLLWQTLRIIKKRDFAEVELLRRQLEYNPLGPASSLLRAPRIRRSSLIISWISCFAGFTLVGFVIYTLVRSLTAFSSTGIGAFGYVMNGSDLARMVAIILGRSNSLISCAAVSFFGFFIFRWRFYETALVWLYISIAIGTFFEAVEMSTHVLLYGSKNADASYLITSAILGSVTLLFMFVCILLAIILVRRMKRELAPQIASSIYEQLEDTLSN